MTVCDFCSTCLSGKEEELTLCRCFHSFCDECANVSCTTTVDDDSNNNNDNFSACSFCPGCVVVQCEFISSIDHRRAPVVALVSNPVSLLLLSSSSEKEEENDDDDEIQKKEEEKPQPPNEFLCPITHELMDDPVVLTDGFSYNRTAIVQWLTIRMVSPMTGNPVANALMPNTVLKVMINNWKEHNNNNNKTMPP